MCPPAPSSLLSFQAAVLRLLVSGQVYGLSLPSLTPSRLSRGSLHSLGFHLCLPPSFAPSIPSRYSPVSLSSADRPADAITPWCTEVPSGFPCFPWYLPLRFPSPFLQLFLPRVLLCHVPPFQRHVCAFQLTPLLLGLLWGFSPPHPCKRVPQYPEFSPCLCVVPWHVFAPSPAG